MRSITVLASFLLVGAAAAQPASDGPAAKSTGGTIAPAPRPPSPPPPGASPSPAPAGAADGSATNDPAALAATSTKFDAYIGYMNRTLRAIDSLARYRSWVNMRTGPTGRERTVYGLYAPYDVTDERAAVEKALAAQPSLPDLDAAVRAYVESNDRLGPTLVKADGYYSRGDYKLDHFKQGQEFHKLIAADGDAFLAARAKLESVMRVEKLALDRIRLAIIEKADGRRGRWHVANVIMLGKKALDDLTASTDVAALDNDLARFGEAVKGLDDYAAAHPRALTGFSSFPDDLLSHMREVAARLKRTKGNLARAAGLDMTFIQSDWNAMVTEAQSPIAVRE